MGTQQVSIVDRGIELRPQDNRDRCCPNDSPCVLWIANGENHLNDDRTLDLSSYDQRILWPIVVSKLPTPESKEPIDRQSEVARYSGLLKDAIAKKLHGS